jgi:tetratricopeptide (TPR) repeat protein
MGFDSQQFEHAVALRDVGHVEEAAKVFAVLTSQATDPQEKASLLLNEARCYRSLGRLADARERLSCALRIAPRTHLVLYLEHEEATLVWHEGDRHKALSMVERLISHYGSVLAASEHRVLYEQVHTSRGMLLTELGKYRDARPQLEECLSFDPRTTEMAAVLYYLGLCSLKLGRAEDAKGRFQQVLRDYPETDCTAMAHLHLGTIYFDEAAYAKAQMEFESCLACEKEGPPKQYLYKWLAVTAKTLGMKEDAERYDKLAKS